jgi:hypothetical protein
MTRTDFSSRLPIGHARFYRGACVMLLGCLIAGLPAHGDFVPESSRVVTADREQDGARAIAEGNVLAPDGSMIDFYDGALARYKRNMREHVPIIVSLLNYAGGRLILYRPSHEPLEAESVPIVYQLAKSVSHSNMAIYQLVSPHLSSSGRPTTNR